MRVVLDTNVTVSALLIPSGPAGQVLAAVKDGRLALCLDAPVFAELERTVRQPRVRRHIRLDDDQIDRFLRNLEALAEQPAGAGPRTAVCVDPDDDKFLDLAAASGAEFLVTGDDHLLRLKTHDATRIVTIRDFLAACQLAGPA